MLNWEMLSGVPWKKSMSDDNQQPETTDEETSLTSDQAEDDVSKNFQEKEDDPLERAQKEGGEEAEFDLEAQVAEFQYQIEQEPDNPVHHYNLGEALEEMGEVEEALEEYKMALALDKEKDFHAIIHFGMGNLYYHDLLSGIQSVVVKSSVGLHSAHKPGDQITEVNDDDYDVPLSHFEKALEFLDHLKADDDLVEYIAKETPGQMANLFYKWASDLIDKARQITRYGGEKDDVKRALRYLKKALDIDPNHAQAGLMITYAKKMLAIGWTIYDEYGFEAKEIEGEG